MAVHHKNVSNANVLHFHAFHFASVSEIASTNLFRVYSLIFSDFVDFSGVLFFCKYCYSLINSWIRCFFTAYQLHHSLPLPCLNSDVIYVINLLIFAYNSRMVDFHYKVFLQRLFRIKFQFEWYII